MDGRQQAELEWAIRNRASLTPEQRAKYRAMWDEANPSAPPLEGPRSPREEYDYRTRGTRALGAGPEDLDPAEAAATPIAPDPMVQPKPARRAVPKPSLTDVLKSANTLASLENFDAAFQSNGSHYPSAIAAFEQQLIARGVEPAYAARAARARAEEHRSPSSTGVYENEMAATEDPNMLYPGYRNAAAPDDGLPPGYSAWAAGMAEAETGMTREERTALADRKNAEWDAKAAKYNRETGLGVPEAITAETGPYPGAGRPGYDRTFTPDELAAQREAANPTPPSAAGYTVPGPRTLDGKPVARPRPLATPEDVEAYNARARDPKSNFPLPSQRDRDMAARGMVPVFNPDGTVGYSVAYPDQDLATGGPKLPGAAGRSGERPDLAAKGWVPGPAMGPTGPVQVYRPGEKAQARYDAQAEDRSRRRMARSAGIASSTASGMTTEALRKAAKDSKDDDAIARNNAWKAQAMLAGGQPTGGRGGSKAITNALMMMPEDQRNSSLRYMLPGGQLAASVDARQLDMAAELAQKAVVGALAGTGSGDLARQQMEQIQRDKAIARADALIQKYPRGWWDGMYDPADVAAVRDAVEKQHPGHGDAAVAHIRVRPASPTPATPPNPTGGAI